MRAVESQSGEPCAIKRLSKSFSIRNHISKQIERELRIHTNLKHRNVIKLYSWFHDDRSIYLVTELASASLATLLSTRYPCGMPVTLVLRLLHQLASGVAYLHSLNVIHRDIKPSNLYLVNETSNSYILKIGDFGSAVHTNPDDLRLSVMGSTPYMAPEIITGSGHSCQADIWSIGITVHELLSNSLPFDGDTPQEIMRKILRSPYSCLETSDVSLSYLLGSCLSKDPQARPKAADINSQLN